MLLMAAGYSPVKMNRLEVVPEVTLDCLCQAPSSRMKWLPLLLVLIFEIQCKEARQEQSNWVIEVMFNVADIEKAVVGLGQQKPK